MDAVKIPYACLLLLCGFVGVTIGFKNCSPSQPGAFGSKNVAWSVSEAGKTFIPGLDRVSVDFGIWGDGAAIVVWSDCDSSRFGGGGMGGRELEPGETRQGVKYEGRIVATDGRSIEIECYTPNGEQGRVEIGGQEYTLDQGSLFLISTQHAFVKVKQLHLNVMNLKPAGSISVDEIDGDTLKRIAQTDQAIRGFFMEAADEPNN